MKIAGGAEEDGLVIGNSFDKYGSRNPIVRRLMHGFDNSLSDLLTGVGPTDIHEIGCGEGYWVLRWLSEGRTARGSDVSSQVIDMARQNATDQGADPNLFQPKSIYDLSPEHDGADLIVCCEVMEHLEEPSLAMKVLRALPARHYILSVPREPIWRFLNLARGKYVSALGNTPGHVQHWSRSAFTRALGEHFEILEVRTPLPWTMVLCAKKE